MLRNVATFVLLFAVWMLWSGHTEALLVGLGLGSCLLVVFISDKMHVLDDEAYAFDLVLRLVKYIPWVLWQVLKTNLEVTQLILSPSLPIHPQLVRIRVSQRTALGQAIHANTITLTPGTVTLDARRGTFLIHALTPDAISPEGAAELDKRVTELEGSPRFAKITFAPKGLSLAPKTLSGPPKAGVRSKTQAKDNTEKEQ